MESVILFVTGVMLGGVVGLITASLCAAAGTQKIYDENARMRNAIQKTHEELVELTEEVRTEKELYLLYKQLKGIQDELKNALEEG